MPEKLLRVSKAAQVLDVSKKRIYQLVAEGRLHAVRLSPRSMRIKEASLESLIATTSEDPAARLAAKA